MKWASEKLRECVNLNKQELNKVICLSLAFFCTIGSSTIFKEIKNSLFAALVGADYLFVAKIVSVVVLIPATLLYVSLIDKMSSYHLLFFYTTLYGVVSLCIALTLQLVGLDLSLAGKIVGWFVYFFYEAQTIVIVGLFWSVMNSVVSADIAKKSYSIMVGFSRLGAIIIGGIAWWLCKYGNAFLQLNDVQIYQIILMLAGALLMVVPFLLRKIDFGQIKQLAVEANLSSKNVWNNLPDFHKIKKHSYVVGIVAMLFFYELVYVTLSVQRIIILKESSISLAHFNETIFQQRVLINLVSLFFSFFVVQFLVKKCGEKICLLLTPIVSSGLLFYLLFFYSKNSLLMVYVAIVSMHVALEKPLREMLYIPTVRNIQFKAKGWESFFGVKLSVWFGAFVGGMVQYFAAIGSTLFLSIYFCIYVIISLFWTRTAWFLGKKYESLIKNNKVIG